MKRSRHIQIYLKPGIREDDLMLAIWESCKRFDRPQDVFRAMLRNGMRAMVQSGEMPYAVVEECNLDAFVEKWRARQPTQQPHVIHMAPPSYDQQPVHAAPRPQPPMPREDVVPVRETSTPAAGNGEHRPVISQPAPTPSSAPETKSPEAKTPEKAKPQADKGESSSGGKRIGNLM